MIFNIINNATELLQSIISGNQAADQQIQKYLRARRNLGARERALLVETVYGCLRRKRLPEHLLDNPQPSALERVATYLVILQGWSARALTEAGFQGDASTLVSRLRQANKLPLPEPVCADLPDWIYQRLVSEIGPEETLKLAEALNRPAPVDLRINTLKAKREEVAALLHEDGYPVEYTPLSPVGLRRFDRAPLFKTRAFQQGLMEVQDEGSQLLSLLLEPLRREMVVDFCAGAGGKTLHIGALMANSGTLYAFDTSAKRLEHMQPRLKRAGLDNVRSIVIEHERDRRIQRLRGKIDRVLVDAPCTGIGTLRRNPDIKWRRYDMERVTALQRLILAAAAELLKSGGRLVYATCSPLREENEDIVTQFLTDHASFKLIPVSDILARKAIPLTSSSPDQETLRLYTHVHQTDSFFAAVLQRTD